MKRYVIDARGAVGDTVSACWIAAGAVSVPDLHLAVLVRRSQGSRGAAGLVDCFGLHNPANTKVVAGHGCCSQLGWGPSRYDAVLHLGLGGPGSAYTYQLMVGGGRRAVVDLWQDVWPFRVQPQRPTITISREAMSWAFDQVSDHGPIAMLYPSCRYGARNWPLSHWLRLSHLISESGFTPIAFDNQKEPIERFSHYYWGHSWERQMALMRLSAFCVTNESGPAHVAGTVGVPTFVLLGPTRYEPNLSYLGNNVVGVSVSKERVPCVGCHFQGYRGCSSRCNSSCEALDSLTSYDVYQRIASWLEADYSLPHEVHATT